MLLAEPSDIPALEHAVLSASCLGLNATTKSGGKATLAVVDESGVILESGEHVGDALWFLLCVVRNNFLDGRGHVRVSSA